MRVKASEWVRDRAWRLLVYRQTMRRFGVGLALSALVGGLYRERTYFIYALCAAAALTLCAAWFEYMRGSDGKPLRRPRPDAPYIWRRVKPLRPHKPAFMRDGMDFDDDLTPLTTAREEGFPDGAASLARAVSGAAAAALLFALSLVL